MSSSAESEAEESREEVAGAAPVAGSVIETRYDDGKWWRGVVTKRSGPNEARVLYDDGETDTVAFPDPEVRVVRVATVREQALMEAKKGGKKRKKAAATGDSAWSGGGYANKKRVPSEPYWAWPETLIQNAFHVPSRFNSKTGWKSDGWRRYAAWNNVAKTVGEALALGATAADIAYHARLGNVTLVDVSQETAEENARKSAALEAERLQKLESTWLARRQRWVAEGADLAAVAGTVEHCAATGHQVTCLGELHPDAGLRGFRRGTAAMPNFVLMSAAGDTIHSTAHEAHEQLVTTWCLRSDDCVLEVGGGIGAVSSMVQQVLAGGASTRNNTENNNKNNKKNHAVVEVQAALCETLATNKKLHASEFTIHEGALAAKAVYSCGETVLDGPDSKNMRQWMFNATTATPGAGRVKVRSLSPKDLAKDKPFTALIVDCEGAFPAIVRDFPTILDGIRVIYVEQDGDAADFKACEAKLLNAGFMCVLAASKHRVYARPTSFSTGDGSWR